MRPNWLPWTNLTGNQLCVEKSVRTRFLALPDIANATLGARLRHLRRSRGLTIEELAVSSGIGRNTLSRLERDATPFNPAITGRILAQFGPEAAKVFPKGQDIYDHLIPTESFGDWLRNFRLRRGMRQKDLADVLGVHKVTICRYERHGFRPDSAILHRLRKQFNLKTELANL